MKFFHSIYTVILLLTICRVSAQTLPSTVILESKVDAYDLNDSTKMIGTFAEKTELSVLELIQDKQMYRVKFTPPNNVPIEALCKSEALNLLLKKETAPPPSNEAKTQP